MKYHQKINRGFTLIELIVVFAIIGLISGVVVQNVTTSRAKARDNMRNAQIDQINKALEISITTSGDNKFPWPGSSAWVCIGSTTPCAGGSFNNNATVNNAIANGISGRTVSSIPKDPLFASGVGDAYLYHPNITPSASGACITAGVCPNGAYLAWVVEQNTSSCGRGVFWQNVSNGYECLLRIGDAVTS